MEYCKKCKKYYDPHHGGCDCPSQEQGAISGWISVDEKKPPTKEPVVYCVKKNQTHTRISVGIAYWTVSKKWSPEMESTENPRGFTHWMPLPEPPTNI